MRRLRLSAQLVCELRCTFTPSGAARRERFFAEQTLQDPLLAALVLSTLAGPDAVPAEAFEAENIDRALAVN